MKIAWLIAVLSICFTVVAGSRLHGTMAWTALRHEAQAATDGSPRRVPVYVTNFELDVVPLPPGQRSPQAANPSQPGAPTEPPPDPAKLASHLVDMMATNLVESLQKAGYPAQRLQPGQGRPGNGVQIRGIFAEVDAQNHWRRAVIRGGSETGAMNALVALANLARPEQALYEIAHLPGNANKPGAVITLSPYVPLEKFDINKNADEKAFAGIAVRVVADLDALLRNNPSALPE